VRHTWGFAASPRLRDNLEVAGSGELHAHRGPSNRSASPLQQNAPVIHREQAITRLRCGRVPGLRHLRGNRSVGQAPTQSESSA
jgi:hypothetical protein